MTFSLWWYLITAAPEEEDKLSADCPSIVSEVFVGHLVNSVRCLSCNKVTMSLVLLSCDVSWDSFCHCIFKTAVHFNQVFLQEVAGVSML